MEADKIPKFSSKDEEINFWKALYVKYKAKYVALCFVVRCNTYTLLTVDCGVLIRSCQLGRKQLHLA